VKKMKKVKTQLMSLLQAYLRTPRAQRALSLKPGEQGFSLIELVVVVAVLAILAAIAIPSFTSINDDARVTGAKTTLANLVKECAVKLVDSNPDNDIYTTPTLAAYEIQVASTDVAGNCGISDTYTAAPKTGFILPSFTIQAATGQKTCVPNATQTGNYELGCGEIVTSAVLDPVTGVDTGNTVSAGTW
jgi:type IV pilus assembly protein PilA